MSPYNIGKTWEKSIFYEHGQEVHTVGSNYNIYLKGKNERKYKTLSILCAAHHYKTWQNIEQTLYSQDITFTDVISIFD